MALFGLLFVIQELLPRSSEHRSFGFDDLALVGEDHSHYIQLVQDILDPAEEVNFFGDVSEVFLLELSKLLEENSLPLYLHEGVGR